MQLLIKYICNPFNIWFTLKGTHKYKEIAMGKGDSNARVTKEDKKPVPLSNSQLFFNQRLTPTTTNNQPSNVQSMQPPPEATEQQALEPLALNSTTDILLAAILKELKTQNMLKLLELQKQQEQENQELSEAEEKQDKENERFENVRYSMYT
jgi:hypothetical protein